MTNKKRNEVIAQQITKQNSSRKQLGQSLYEIWTVSTFKGNPFDKDNFTRSLDSTTFGPVKYLFYPIMQWRVCSHCLSEITASEIHFMEGVELRVEVIQNIKFKSLKNSI